MSIRKVIKKYKINEQPNKFSFWQSKSYEEGLEALAEIRKEYNSWRYDAGQATAAAMQRRRRAPALGGAPVGTIRDADQANHEASRFGLIALSEIACRALSPAVNDPGTAIAIIGRFVRLWANRRVWP